MFKPTKFASFDENGELLALVAEGLPEFPADGDLSTLDDAQIGELHDALVESIPALSEDPEFDPADATVLAERITALRDEAARRLAIEPPAADPAPEPDQR